MKTKIKIKDIFDKVLFSYKCEDNTIKKTVEEAVKQKISLCNANLCNAKLNNANLRGADLFGADLSGVNLCGVDLCNANLNYVNLNDAKLCDVNLSGANLYAAELHRADLCYVNLRGADLCSVYLNNVNLSGANLSGADLCYADLCGAYFSWADLYGANLDNAKNVPFILMACPSEGSFIGWKKVDNYLIKLFIPEDAKRSSSTTNKCRCDKAKVLEIVDLKTNEHIDEIINYNYVKCIYKVDEIVRPDSFDDNRWNECSHGIHFFINKQEAINY